MLNLRNYHIPTTIPFTLLHANLTQKRRSKPFSCSKISCRKIIKVEKHTTTDSRVFQSTASSDGRSHGGEACYICHVGVTFYHVLDVLGVVLGVVKETNDKIECEVVKASLQPLFPQTGSTRCKTRGTMWDDPSTPSHRRTAPYKFGAVHWAPTMTWPPTRFGSDPRAETQDLLYSQINLSSCNSCVVISAHYSRPSNALRATVNFLG